MNIYLVRHGETDWNAERRLMGQTDIPLNKIGKDQAENLRIRLEDVDFDVCFTSPLKRAKETASIICNNKCQIIEDDLLKESFGGKNQGKLIKDCDFEDSSMETEESIFDRAKRFLDKIKNIDCNNVLIVSHSGPIKNMRHILLRFDGGVDYNGWEISNCDFTLIKI